LARDAAQHEPLLRLLLDHERRTAARAWREPRAIPHGERAVGIARTAVERLAAPRPPLGDLALPALGARDAERERLGEVALRPARPRAEAGARATARDER